MVEKVEIDVDRVCALNESVAATLEQVAKGDDPRDVHDRMVFLERISAQLKEIDYVTRDLRSAQLVAAA